MAEQPSSGQRRRKRRLKPQEKYQVWQEVVTGQGTQREMADRWGIDRSTVTHIIKFDKQGALERLGVSKPGRPGKSAAEIALEDAQTDVSRPRPLPRPTNFRSAEFIDYVDFDPQTFVRLDPYDVFYSELRVGGWASRRLQELDLPHRPISSFNDTQGPRSTAGPCSIRLLQQVCLGSVRVRRHLG